MRRALLHAERAVSSEAHLEEVSNRIGTPAKAGSVLLLGGYGLLGRSIGLRLRRDGFEIVALGRDPDQARRALPGVQWIIRDLGEMTQAQSWIPLLRGVGTVVNAAGLLQDSTKDKVNAIQTDAIVALIQACERCAVQRYVQISAPGVSEDSASDFMRSKAIADRMLRQSRLNWTIFRPGLVIAPNAYGGSAALRALAAAPWFLPIMHADSQIQTVAMAEVAEAVSSALVEPIYDAKQVDLVEQEPQSLLEIVLALRSWLGVAKPRFIVRLPERTSVLVARLADLAGCMGWRNPMRSAALSALKDNVLGDPTTWMQINGRPLMSLAETLAAMPATRQERRFARTQLLFPILVLTTALFWIASGCIGIYQLRAAAALIDAATPNSLSLAMVVIGALLDIVIGVGLLWRRYFLGACQAGLLLCVVYALMGAALTPELWLDPLGPLVKIIPVAGLMAVLMAIGEPR